ncbi:hypothetical protein [Paenibacillus larvae]|uniref:hypothetical protein n=1 Tax=Paenibacillus larvae TaxID=1464 RepID=UPI0028925767|nr:hypothetical protein [Paenibacillus larvae]MDT2192068.1 hypothetical protein [Paenibacillus larvae]
MEKASGALDRTIHKVARDPSCCGISQYYSWHGSKLILSNNENMPARQRERPLVGPLLPVLVDLIR